VCPQVQSVDSHTGVVHIAVQAKISFIFDDGYPSLDTHVAPLFASTRLRCGFAVNSRRLLAAGPGTIARILARQVEGFEICNHGARHINLSRDDVDPNTAAMEIRTGYSELVQMGFNIHTYVAANSVVTDAFIPLLMEDHASAYTVYRGRVVGSDALMPRGQDRYKLHRTSLYNAGIAGAIETIDAAIEKGGYICFYDHDPLQVDYERSMPIADLAQVLKYCQTKGVNVVTPYEAGAWLTR
jgi:hypothetical protein